MEATTKHESATELLMAVAERMSQYGEGEDVLVVWNTTNGEVRMKANCNYTRSLGLAEYASAELKDSLVNSVGGDA